MIVPVGKLPWPHVMIDSKGPITPADMDGFTYIFTYTCCLHRGSLLEATKTLRNSERDALLGIGQRLSSAWRPWEQAPTERGHQETQRSLGTLLKSVFTCAPGEWAGLLPVVEFIRVNTPGAAGITPRDLERAWPIVSPFERELLPLDEGESQSVAEVVRQQFEVSGE